MKLSKQQLESVLFGAEELQWNEEILTPYKVSKPTRDAWFALEEGLGLRAEVPTGCRLDFVTDSGEVTFTLTGTPYDCLVDGLLTDRFEGSKSPEAFSVTLDGQPHRVTLIFPSHNGIIPRIHGVEVCDGASVTPHEYGEKFLFLGDSITQGWDSGIDSLSYAWRTSLFFNADCRIYGVGGACFYPSTFEKPAKFDPDRVFVAFGTNDFGHFKTLEDLRTAASDYLDLVCGAFGGKKIYGITPIWRYDTWIKPMGTFDECIDVIREEYEKRSVPVIDGLDLVPHNKTFFADALHPNALGFSLYAENLIRFLQEEEA